MFRRTLACAVMCIALGGPLCAENSPLVGLAQDILEHARGAPANARHDAYMRLRQPGDGIVEAVWKVSNVRLHPTETSGIWPSQASETYQVLDCVQAPAVRAKPPVVGLLWRMERPSPRATVRRVAAREFSTRRIALLFPPTGSLAIEAHASADGELSFAGNFVIEAEVASEVAGFRFGLVEVLGGAEPEGTLATLVPNLESRTVRIDGAIWSANAEGSRPGNCPHMRFTANLGPDLPPRTQTCRLATSSRGTAETTCPAR